MSRVQIGSAYVGPSGDLYGALDGNAAGLTIADGDHWYSTQAAVAAPYPYPTFTDHPVIKYAALFQPGDTFDVVLSTRLPAYLSANSLGSLAYVEIPAGFDEQINGFNQVSNQYGCYAPACVGIWGQGPDQSRISMRSLSMSAATKATIPTQAAGGINNVNALRIGPANGTPIHNYGFTVGGRDQGTNPVTGLPYSYNGFFFYQEGGGSTHTWLKVLGFGAADYNAPPGETNQIGMYRCSNVTLNGVEVSGINLDGTQTGGACAPNGSTNIVYNDVYVHDTARSGVTQSTAGSAQTGTPTTNITTNRLRALHNANHSPTPFSGGGFPGINHEGVAGTIQHNNPEIIRDNANGWNGCHVYIASMQNSSVLNIIEPNYHPEIASAQPPYARGCFAIQCPATYGGVTNQQQLSDIHVVLNGVTLTAVTSANGVPPAPASVDPARTYVVSIT